MKVDQNELIAGVRPAVLKGLLRKDVFSTPTAMKVLSLDEPDATSALVTLMNEGWIEFKETKGFVDWWRTGDRGQRLTATSLLRRIPAAEGRKIIDALVGETRTVNAEPSNSQRIVSIRVFGSALTAGDGEYIGDVDVVVDVRRRKLAEADLIRLEQREKLEMPESVSFLSELYWPERRIKRRLARVSRWLSLHQAQDIDGFNAPYRTVYAFDLDTEQEMQQDLAIRRSTRLKKDGQCNKVKQKEHAISKVWGGPRPWPVAPNRKVTANLREEDACLAQHLWQNGADLAFIAKQLRMTKREAEAFLAGRRCVSPRVKVAFDGAFKRTVLRALPADRTYVASVELHLRNGLNSMIDIDLHDSRSGREIASLRWLSGRYIVHHAHGSLIPELESVLTACKEWLTRMRSRARGLELTVLAHCDPHESADGATASPVSLSRLALTLTATLDQVWPHPRAQYEGWDRALEVTLSDPPEVIFREGTSHKTAICDERIRLVLDAVRDLLLSHSGALADGAAWSAAVRGSALASE